MYKNVFFFLGITFFFSCAQLPIETLTLTDAVIEEGKRMHQLNLKLLNKMFEEKRADIDEFIENKYTPEYINNYQSLIPEDIDYETELSNIIGRIIPAINARRDSMQLALEEQRVKLANFLMEDYSSYIQASSHLRSLIESEIKLDNQKRIALQKAMDLTGRDLNLDEIEDSLDNFIISGGNVGEKIDSLKNSINSIIQN